MQDSKLRDDAAPDVSDEELIGKRKTEATSAETLEDIETTETDFGSGGTDSDPGPSPDGPLDEPDEIKDAGPM